MARIKTGFSTFSNAGLLIEAARIITSMTGNAHFTDPVPPLSEVKDAYEAFDTAMSAMGNGNKNAKMVKNKTRAKLDRLLGELALYVQLRSKGEELILQSSGYELVNMSTSADVLPKPSNFTAIPADAHAALS